MYFKLITVLLCCMTLCTVSGQNYTNSNLDIFNQVHLATGLTYNNNPIETYDGSPYMNDNFLEGKIYLNDSLVEQRVLLRHNIYTDDMEVKAPFRGDTKEKYSALFKDESVSAEILFQKYQYFPNFDNESNGARGAYLIIINKGAPYTLLQKNDVIFRPEIVAKTPYDEERDAFFEQIKTYYLLNTDGTMTAAPTSKSKWFRLFENHKSDLKKFFKQNDINFDEKQDVTKLVNFINQLTK
ncbi:hypothetical protein [Cochleicola gelatinilyticus]|nr:hypothetical protein [Cochleicola gelatinilyticus]